VRSQGDQAGSNFLVPVTSFTLIKTLNCRIRSILMLEVSGTQGFVPSNCPEVIVTFRSVRYDKGRDREAVLS